MRLVVRIHDAAKRPSVARRVARNLDVLLRGMGAVVDGGVRPDVEFLNVPACPVVSQRSVCAFGLLLGPMRFAREYFSVGCDVAVVRT